MTTDIKLKVGDWVWRVRLIRDARVVHHGPALVCRTMDEVTAFIGTETPRDIYPDGYAVQPYQLGDEDFIDGELGGSSMASEREERLAEAFDTVAAQLTEARAALEEIAALQTEDPSMLTYRQDIALGRWDAAEIARKALGGGK